MESPKSDLVLDITIKLSNNLKTDRVITGSRRDGMWATDHPHKLSLLLSHLYLLAISKARLNGTAGRGYWIAYSLSN